MRNSRFVLALALALATAIVGGCKEKDDGDGDTSTDTATDTPQDTASDEASDTPADSTADTASDPAGDDASTDTLTDSEIGPVEDPRETCGLEGTAIGACVRYDLNICHEYYTDPTSSLESDCIAIGDTWTADPCSLDTLDGILVGICHDDNQAAWYFSMSDMPPMVAAIHNGGATGCATTATHTWCSIEDGSTVVPSCDRVPQNGVCNMISGSGSCNEYESLTTATAVCSALSGTLTENDNCPLADVVAWCRMAGSNNYYYTNHALWNTVDEVAATCPAPNNFLCLP